MLCNFTVDSFVGNKMVTFNLLTCSEVKSLVMSSPPKSCPLDPIPTKFIINNINCITESLKCIINDYLESGIMPSCLKHALVTPLIKKPNIDQNDLKNYCPVSNLPFISKLIEKAVAIQINDNLAKYELLELNQSAYRKHHNTETALI